MISGGDDYYIKNNYEKAYDYYKKALKYRKSEQLTKKIERCESRLLPVLKAEAEELYSKGQIKSAINKLNKYLEINDDSDVRNLLKKYQDKYKDSISR